MLSSLVYRLLRYIPGLLVALVRSDQSKDVELPSNTGSVQISFAPFHGDLPLAVALLIAMVTRVVVTPDRRHRRSHPDPPPGLQTPLVTAGPRRPT